MRMGTAAFTGDRVDCLDELRAHAEEAGVGEGHDIALPDPRLEILEDVLIYAVDHRARLCQENDLIGALDFPGHHHRLLAVGDVEAFLLQGQKDPRLGHVDPERLRGDPLVTQHGCDLGRGTGVEATLRADGALQSGIAPDRILLVEHRRQLQTMGFGGRAEVPQPGPARPGDQRPALTLVERPIADLGGSRVPDVGSLEQQQGSQSVMVELLANPVETVRAKSFEIDSLLPIHSHDAWRPGGRNWKLTRRNLFRQRPLPPSLIPGVPGQFGSQTSGQAQPAAKRLNCGTGAYACQTSRFALDPGK